MKLDKMMEDAQSRDFHPVNLGAKLKAHMVSKIRNFESNNVARDPARSETAKLPMKL